MYDRFHGKTVEEKLITLNHTLYVISVFKVPGVNIRGVERIGTANPQGPVTLDVQWLDKEGDSFCGRLSPVSDWKQFLLYLEKIDKTNFEIRG